MPLEITSYKNIWKVSYPIIAGSIAQNIINVVDTAFLGRLGPIELGAAGNAIIFYFAFIVLGMGFGIGGEIIVGRRNGEKNFTEIGRVIDHCFYVLIPLSVVLFVVMNLFAYDIMALTIVNPEILSKGAEYIDYRMYGIFFAFANICFRTFFIGITKTSILIWSTSVMAIVNILFDYLLIFGNHGFPELGVKGAAIASILAEMSALIYFLIYVFSKVDRKKYGLLYFKSIRNSIIKRLIKVSSPIMIQYFIAVSSWLIFFLIIEKMGTRELAISHIIRSIYMVLMVPLFGFASATNALVSNIIGLGRKEEVIAFTRKVVFLTIIMTAFILPINLVIPESMISLFTTDFSLVEESIPVLYIISISMFVFSIAEIVFSAVSGTGNTVISLTIEIATLVIYLLSAYYIAIMLKAPLHIVWCTEFIYFGIMGALSILYLRFGNWRNKVI